MMYSCISQLPFFDQFEIDKETLIQELSNNNNKNTEGGIFEIDIDKNAKNNNNMQQNQTTVFPEINRSYNKPVSNFLRVFFQKFFPKINRSQKILKNQILK